MGIWVTRGIGILIGLVRLYSSKQRPFAEIRHIAVAIAVVEAGQQHVGILHREEILDEVRLAHLAWHNQLKDNHTKDAYLWIELPIPERRARQVAARCRQILRANLRGIPYAFSPPNDCFDSETGRFLFGPSRLGLTCSTFVLAVFDSAGIRFADYATWPQQRSGDYEWQQSIIAQLEKDGAASEHIDFIRNEIGAVRYRPEDVAGCAAADGWPCPFTVAGPLSREILKQLQLHAMPLRGP
jgi:hypothetical protein